MNPAQRLILGLREPQLTNSIKKFFNDKQVGGVVLFDQNAKDFNQLKKLIADINEACSVKPFIAIDFEGGRVRRFAGLFESLKKPIEYVNNFAELKLICEKIGKTFKEIGININLAPVVDLSYQLVNPALIDRTFSHDPSQTAEYSLSFFRGFSENDVICCLKHFPGLGSAVNDPHNEVALSCISKEMIMGNDIIPFKAGITKGIKMIMTTHLLLTAIDYQIATFSKRVIGLARELGFGGIMITDDLSMESIKKKLLLPEAVLKALCAGHDMALICHDHDSYTEIVNCLEDNLNLLQQHGHEGALQRISDVKKTLP